MDKTKFVYIAVITAISSWIGILAVPVIILVICNLIDYGTGLVAAKYREQNINSEKSYQGIWKKVCMWLLIGVGILIDALLLYTAAYLEIQVGVAFLVAIVVSVWLIVNEIISILENINDIGVDIPPFLMPLMKNIKSQVEQKSNIESEEQHEDEGN